MLKCEEVVQTASEYLDSKMSIRKKTQYMIHLLMCYECRKFLNYFKRIYSTQHHFHQKLISEEKVDNIMNKIEQNSAVSTASEENRCDD